MKIEVVGDGAIKINTRDARGSSSETSVRDHKGSLKTATIFKIYGTILPVERAKGLNSCSVPFPINGSLKIPFFHQ